MTSLSPEIIKHLKQLSRRLKLIDGDELIDKIEKTKNIDTPVWWNDSTPLMIAVLEDNLDLVTALLEAGANVDLTSSQMGKSDPAALKNTPLMIAAESSSLEIVKRLIDAHKARDSMDHDCDFDPINGKECTLKEDTGVLAKNANGQTALMFAIEAGRIDVVKELLKYSKHHQLSCLKNNWSKSPLLIACEFGKDEIVDYLVQEIDLENRPELHDKITNGSGLTPLMYACMNDTESHKRIAKRLLGLSGINVMTKPKFPASALTFACSNSSKSLVETILNKSSFKVYDESENSHPDIELLELAILNMCKANFFKHKRDSALTTLNDRLSTVLCRLRPRLRKIRRQALKTALKYGHIELATTHFMYHQNDGDSSEGEEEHADVTDQLSYKYHRDPHHYKPPKDIFHCRLRDILHKKEDRSEMMRRLHSKKDDTLEVLVKLAAFYHLHFDILTTLLVSLDSRIAILDDHFPTFFKCLEMGARASVHAITLNDEANDAEARLGLADNRQLMQNMPSSPAAMSLSMVTAFDNAGADSSVHNAEDFGEVIARKKINDMKMESKSFAYLRKVYQMMSKEDRRACALPRDIVSAFPNHLTDVEIVNKLVQLVSILTIESGKRAMERVDIMKHLKTVEDMLVECFRASQFTSSDCLQKFLPPHHYEMSLVRDGHAFMNGPLEVCIRNGVSAIFNSGHVNSFVDKLYWGFLQKSNFNPRTMNKFLMNLRLSMARILPLSIFTVRAEKVVQLRSNLLFLRFNPASMFFAEGLSKALFLALVVQRAVYVDTPNQMAVAVMVIALLMYEVGELCDNMFMAWPSFSLIRKYLSSRWNRIDIIGYACVVTGLVLDLKYDSSANRGAFALAAIFTSLSMLNYCSAYEPIGQLVIMVFAMMTDMLKFVLIFVISIFGFCVAMYCLARNIDSGGDDDSIDEFPPIFESKVKTFLNLFSASFANYDSFDDQFAQHDSKFRNLAIGIELTYIVFSAVILLNLVIARMSATHDKIDQKAFEEWQYTRAETVYSFLLLEERNPLSMVPAPFNLVTTFFGLFIDYPRILLNTYQHKQINRKLATDGSKVKRRVAFSMRCVSGTVCNWVIGIIVSFVGPFLEMAKYIFETISSGGNLSDLKELFTLSSLFLVLIYPLYVLSLLVETVQMLTDIQVTVNGDHEWDYSIIYDETYTPETQHPKGSYISFKIVRVSGPPQKSWREYFKAKKDKSIMCKILNWLFPISVGEKNKTNPYPFLAPSHLPVLAIRLQDIVFYTGQAVLSAGAFVFPDPEVKFPFSQINWDKEITLSIVMIDKDALTGKTEVVATSLASEEQVHLWMANGRFEGSLDFKNNRGSVQIVVKTKIAFGDDQSENHSFGIQTPKKATEKSAAKHSTDKSCFKSFWYITSSHKTPSNDDNSMSMSVSKVVPVSEGNAFEENEFTSIRDISQQTTNTEMKNDSSNKSANSFHTPTTAPGLAIDTNKLMRPSTNIDRLRTMRRQSLFSMDEVSKIFTQTAAGEYGDSSGDRDGKMSAAASPRRSK